MSNVRDFGAAGDGKTDDTDAILHAVQQGDGALTFPRGDYLISRTIEIELDKVGRTGLSGEAGTAKIIMTGPGPAIRLVGTHSKSADPLSMPAEVWSRQRMPSVLNIEIEGRHPEADGLELDGTMQAVLEGVLLHGLRDGVRLTNRNRNVIISHCHVYHNTGVGVFLDRCNLHQINIVGSHISYNRRGGIRIEGSEIRNLQITGCDIEYNNHRTHRKLDAEPAAEIYIDTRGAGSVAEVTIASCTIQSRPWPSNNPHPAGANIRIIGKPGQQHPPGLWTITGNVLGNQYNNLHLTHCEAFSITGNFIYSCIHRNVLLENCRQIVLSGNNFRTHNIPRFFAGVRLVECNDCVISGCQFADEYEQGQPNGASLLELVDCDNINVNGSQFVDGAPYAIHIERSSHVNLSGCNALERRETPVGKAAVRWDGAGRANRIAGCTIDGDLQIDDEANVEVSRRAAAGRGE